MRLIDADKLKEYMESGALRAFLTGHYKMTRHIISMLNSFYEDVDEQPIVDFRDILNEFYEDAEIEYQSINGKELPADDELTYHDGYRQAAYDAWEIVCEIYRKKYQGDAK